MDAATLRAEISLALAADLGTYTLLNGETTPAISVRPEGARLAAGTTAAGLEVVILAEPRLSPVGAYLQQDAWREYFVFLVGWDETADITTAAEKLIYFFPGTEWQEIPIAKRVGPTNQARVIIRSTATPGLITPPGPSQGASVRTLVITGSATGSSGGAIIGASAVVLPIAGISAGQVLVIGGSNQSFAITGSATGGGQSQVNGSSSSTFSLAGSAGGAVVVVGASTAAQSIAGIAAGAVALRGASSAALAISGSATGAIGAVAAGGSTATLSLTGSASATVRVAGSSAAILAIAGTAAGIASNPIVAENALSGVSDSTVGFSTIGSGVNGFYGYAKQFSRNVGETIDFAVDGVNAANIAIHRIGHYAGNRWRLVTTVTNTGTNQPDTQALTNGAGARTASNWSTTASWTIPPDAVSGLYIGVVRNASNQAQSWIPFIVREDSRTADIVIRVSDTTWGAAYNTFGTKADPTGGKSVYGEGKGGNLFTIELRGVQMSYDRPIVSRGETAGANVVNHWDVHESALIDWVEKNGFNVKYISCYDLDQGLAAVGSARVLLNAGHDEYWSDGMLNNTEAFIEGGGHVVSMSANTQFWRIRWADGGRTFYCYKDTMPGPTVLRTGGAGSPLDPVSWTGTWRDTRWAQRRPENLLLAGTFRMNGIRDETMVINGAANQAKPFWRSTTVASGTNLTVTQVIGFEGDSLDFPNTGGVNLGTTDININGSYANDDGQFYDGNGTLNWGIACHYPRPAVTSSGLVFNFCTNQWMWGLSDYHRRGGAVNNREMRQATYNLLTDLGATAATKESDLTTVSAVALSTYGATKPNEVTVAVAPSSVSEDGTTNLVYTFTRTQTTGTLAVNYTIGGTATNGTDYASIASPVNFIDGSGTATVTVNPITDATFESNETVVLTVTSGAGYIVGSPSVATGTITNDDAGSFLLTPLGSVGSDTSAADSASYEMGTRFTVSAASECVAITFYRPTTNSVSTAARTWTVTLWNDTAGTSLATATVATGTGFTGWATATFSSPVALSTGITYLASVGVPSAGYNATASFFTAPVTPGGGNPLSAPIGAGVFNTTIGSRPDTSFNNTYYYVQPEVAIPTPGGNSSRTLAITGSAAGTVRVTGSSNQSLTITGNASSSSANFGASSRILSITGTAAGTVASGVTNYQLVSDATVGTNNTSSNGNDAGAYEMGTEFTVSTACNLVAIKFLRPATNGVSTAARTWTVRLWNRNTSAQIGTATVSTGAGFTGWATATFASPIALVTTTDYIASFSNPGAGYQSTSGFFSSPVTPGAPNPISTPVDAGKFAGTVGNIPTGSFGNAFYYVQPVVSA